MADELEPVTQAFIADMSDYVHPIEEAAADTEVLAEAVRQVDEALGTLRDDAAEAAAATGDLDAALGGLAASEDDAAASSAELDHELHDQADSLAADAVAAAAAGASMDGYAAAVDGATVGMRDAQAAMLDAMGPLADLGSTFSLTKVGANEFALGMYESAAAAEAADGATTDAETGMLFLGEAMTKVRDKSAEAAAAADFLGLSLEGTEKIAKEARDALLELGFSETEAAAGAAALAAAQTALDATMAAGGGGGGFFSGILEFLGGIGGNPFVLVGVIAAVVALGAAIAAVIQEIGLLIAGFTAAGAGILAFAALAYPTFSALRTGITALSTATGNYQAASQTLDISIHSSHADWVAYQATIHGLEPDLQNAARLLTNQNVQWQNLSPSMQKSVIALSDNSAALKLLLPDQQAALTALLAERTAWNNLTPAQQQAALSLQALSTAYHNLANAFAPDVLKIFDQGLKILTDLLPDIKPLADTAATAISNLLGQLQKLVAPPAATPGSADKGLFKQYTEIPPLTGFQQFIKTLSSISGPALTAIGQGLGQVAGAFGKLITALPKQDVINAIHIFFTTLTLGLELIALFAVRVANDFTSMKRVLVQAWHDIDLAAQTVNQWTSNVILWVTRMYTKVQADIQRMATDVILWFARMFTNSVQFAERMYNDVESWFNRMVLDVVTFAERMYHDVVTWIQRMVTDAVSYVKTMPAKIVSALSSLPGRLLQIGIQAIDGLLHGLQSAAGGVLSWVRGLASTISGIFASALSILSPSLVFYGHGVNIVQGLINGMESKRGELLATVRSLGTGTTTALTSTASQNIVQHQVTVNLANVMSGPAQLQSLQRAVQAAILTHANQNAGSMLVLPGRRS